MRKLKLILKVLLSVVVVALIVIQFFRPVKNADAEIAEEHITAKFQIPEDVQQVLKVSCYDCHSNTTHYPWYSNVQPVAWFLDDHVREGKRELNFSKFATYPAWRQYKKFKEIGKELKEEEMPLFSYTLVHRDAALSEEQRLSLQNWAASAMKEMEAQYPAASLEKP